MPKTPPNCGLRKTKSTSNARSTPLSTSAHVSSTNHAQPDHSTSNSSQIAINGTFDPTNSSSQNVDQSHLTNFTCDQNQNAASSNEDLTKFSKSQSFSKSPKPRLPRTSSNSKVNQNCSPLSSKSNSPNVVRKSKDPVSKSTFYGDECDSVETHSGKSCFYVAPEDSGSKTTVYDNQADKQAAGVDRNSLSETASCLNGENTKTNSTKKPSKIPPKVPPKVSPKRVGSQKNLSASGDSQPNFVPSSTSECVSQNIEVRIAETLALPSGDDSGHCLKVEIDSAAQDVNGNSNVAKVQTLSPSIGGKTPSPRPRPQPKPRKSMTPSPRKIGEKFEDDIKSDESESVDPTPKKETDADKLRDDVDKVSESVDEVKDNVEKVLENVENSQVEKGISCECNEEEKVKDLEQRCLVNKNPLDNVDVIYRTSEAKSSKESPVDQTSIVCDKTKFNEPLDHPEINTRDSVRQSEEPVLSAVEEDNSAGNVVESDSKKPVDILGEDLPETSSLLDEIEKIVTKRMNSLENDMEEKNQNVPIRPPRPKRESKKTSSICLDGNQEEGDFRGSTSSVNEMPPPSVKKPPKPKRHKLNKNAVSRSQSDVSGIRSHGLDLCSNEINIDASEDDKDKNGPIVPPRRTQAKGGGKGRSLTVDFCVPANQHALLREIALADHRRELEASLSPKSSQSVENLHTQTSLQGTNRQLRPSRKAPPPPPPSIDSTPKSTKTNLKDSTEDITHPHHNSMLRGSLSAPTLSDDDTSSVEAHEYHYIPEDLINPPSADSTLHREISPSPPDLPPRTYNTSLSTSTSVIGQSVLNDSCLSDKDRPMSVVSVFSSQSESGSFGHGNDESSSEDSETESSEDKVKYISALHI